MATERRASPRSGRRRRRRRRSEESDDDGADDALFPQWKLFAVLAVIGVCFAVLYPKMFHPMLMLVLGRGEKAPEQEAQQKFPHPPFHAGGGSRGGGPQAGHPAMRMAAQQAASAHTESGRGSKGTWHWMLPFYTVGVIVFLLYTLSKIVFRAPPSGSKKRKANGMRYNTRRDRFEVDGATPRSSDSDFYEADDARPSSNQLNNRQLHGLQRRLQQTELAMHKILAQLEQVASTGPVDAATAHDMKQMTMDTLQNLQTAGDDDDDGERPVDGAYLRDVEQALSDFKKLADTYVKEHSAPAATAAAADEPAAAGDDESSEAEDEGDSCGFDGRDSEDADDLTVDAGEGELIDLNAAANNVDAAQSHMRKRRIT